MSKYYEKIIQNLNVVKWELKNRNDPTCNLCIKYIKDAILDAGRLNDELEKYQFLRSSVDLDVCDGSD